MPRSLPTSTRSTMICEKTGRSISSPLIMIASTVALNIDPASGRRNGPIHSNPVFRRGFFSSSFRWPSSM